MRQTLASLLIVASVTGCSGLRSVADSTPPPIDPAAVMDALPAPDPILAAGNRSPYTVNGQRYEVLPTAAGYREEGIASWYGLKFHGRPTANGDRFSVYGPTAAHKTLPIPSYVRVTNLSNGKAMTLRVNDRGPFHADRIIDVSYGAALKLGFAEQGTAQVFVEALIVPGVDDRRQIDGRYRFLQLGAFSDRVAAVELQRRVQGVLTVPIVMSPITVSQRTLYRLRAGPFGSEEALRHGQSVLAKSELPVGQPLP